MRWSVVLVASLLLITGAAIGATLRVPQDYPTIQAAVESARPGDEVVISPGTYGGGVFVDKDLTLRGEGEVILAGGFVPSEDQINLEALYGLLAHSPRLSFTVRICILVNGAHVILENLALERADIGLWATEEAEVSCRKLAAAASYWDVVGQGNAQLALEGCEFGPTIGAGLFLSDSAMAELASCTFQVEPSRGPAGTGLEVFPDPELYPAAVFLKDSARLRLEGCELLGGRAGVRGTVGVSLGLGEQVAELSRCAVRGFYQGFLVASGRLELADSRIQDCTFGLIAAPDAEVELLENTWEGCERLAIWAWRGAMVTGADNIFSGNLVDLAGYADPGLRRPLHRAELLEARYPSPDFSSLQEAVDAVLPGGMVVLAAPVAEGATLVKDLTLRGVEGLGPGEAFLSLVGGVEVRVEKVPFSGQGEVLVAAGRLTMNGVRFSGEGEGENLMKGGIDLLAGASAALEDCVFEGYVAPIRIWQGAGTVELRSCVLRRGGTGIWAEKAEDVCLAGCTISGFSRGVYLDGGSLLAIDTGFFSNGTSLFLDAHAGAVCRDCTFAPSGTAVVLGPRATFEGEGCVFRGGAGPAIRTAALKGFELTLRGSRIENVQGDALYLMSTGSANLEECSIQGNAGAGIRLGAGAELSLTGCTIAGNRWGILIEAKSCELAVYKRTFTGAISGGGNEISGNTEADLCPAYPGPPWPADFLAND